MLATRVIPCLDVAHGRVVKGVKFQGLTDQGDPVELAARYAEQGADELGRPVLQHGVQRQTACHEGTEADSGVHMAARDGADAVGHGHDGETEGEGDAELADFAASKHGGAATQEH